MTSLPSRLNSLRAAVRSLLRQRGVSISSITLVLPRSYSRSARTWTETEITSLQEMSPKVRIVRDIPDLGPGTKYLGASASLPTYVCDDDRVYHPFAVARLVRRTGTGVLVAAAGKKTAPLPPALRGLPRPSFWGFRGLLLPPGGVPGYRKILEGLPSRLLEIDDDTATLAARKAGLRIVTVPGPTPRNWYRDNSRVPLALWQRGGVRRGLLRRELASRGI